MPHVCVLRDVHTYATHREAASMCARSAHERRDREGTEAGANGKKPSSKDGGPGAPGCERERESGRRTAARKSSRKGEEGGNRAGPTGKSKEEDRRGEVEF